MILSFVTTRRRFLLALAFLAAFAPAAAGQTQSVTLQWDPNTEADLAGYRIRYGTQPGVYTGSVDVGKLTTWTINGLQNDYRYYFVVEAYNTSGVISQPSNQVNTDGIFVQSAGPLLDVRPDVFWHHQTRGELLTWHLNGTAVVDTRRLTIPAVPDTAWKVVGTGDLNGDGFTDLVWRNQVDGKLVAWLLQNEQVLGTFYLSITQVADLNWKIRAVADFDGDRRADLIWQHETVGTLVVWFMNGPTVTAFQYVSAPRFPDPAVWRIAGATDLNRDGKADLIWQNYSTGDLGAWLMNGSAMASWGGLSIGNVADLDWKIRGAGDLNGDGLADLIWQNTTTGGVVLWTLNGYEVMFYSYLSAVRVDDTAWHVVGAR